MNYVLIVLSVGELVSFHTFNTKAAALAAQQWFRARNLAAEIIDDTADPVRI